MNYQSLFIRKNKFTNVQFMVKPKKQILIAGAGGFIGSHLAWRLHKIGYSVRAVDIKWNDYMEKPYFSEKLTMDLREFSNCVKATQGIEWVFNLASDMGGMGYISKAAADLMSNNFLINLNLLKACVKNNVSRYFFSSSACVYPSNLQITTVQSGLKEEDTVPANPDTFYGWEKLLSEKLCEAYAKDYSLNIRIARYHNIYGPYGTYDGGREKAPAALCRKVIQAASPGTIEIWGDGDQTRSFCYIDDCIDGTLLLMQSSYNKPMNIGSDQLISINHLADLIINISGKKILKSYKKNAPQGVRGRNADISNAKNILNWEPKVTLKNGLKTTCRWIESELKLKTK